MNWTLLLELAGYGLAVLLMVLAVIESRRDLFGISEGSDYEPDKMMITAFVLAAMSTALVTALLFRTIPV